MTITTPGARDHWLESRTEAGGTGTLAYSFFGSSLWLRGQQVQEKRQETPAKEIAGTTVTSFGV